MKNNSFLRNNIKSGKIGIYRQPKNSYCKLCVIPVIDNYCIFLTIKLLPPLRKGKLIYIHTCLFKNNHKWYSSIFDRRTPHIKFFIQPLDVQVWSPLEKVSCDIFCLCQYLPLHPLQNFSKVCLCILLIFHLHNFWILLSISHLFDKLHTETISQSFLKRFLVDFNGQHIATLIFNPETYDPWGSYILGYQVFVQCPIRKLVDYGTGA